MSSKDKDFKIDIKMIKNFFKNKGGSQGYSSLREEVFKLTPELEKDLCSDSPLNVRIKTIKELTEIVKSNHQLEDNAAAKLWGLLEDLFSDNVSKENRHLVFLFFCYFVQGQKLDMMRAKFFELIKNHSNPEDVGQRLDLLQSLTDNGKDIEHIEAEIGHFLLNSMQQFTRERREIDFLNILIRVIRFNASYIDEDVIEGIVESTCVLCCQTEDQQVVLRCLQVLDTIVCYTTLPCESLPPFIATLCRTVNLEIYCPTSWKVMRNLLGTHLGHSTLFTMCKILKSDASQSDVGLLRGAVFYINMALWSNKKVTSLKCTPGAVLPSFKSALRCTHGLVMYEVILSIQRLISTQGNELLYPTWSVVLDVIHLILQHVEENNPAPSLQQVSSHLHETLTLIEQLIGSGVFNGCSRTVYEIIERCASQRPEASVQRLISYKAQDIVPTRELWLNKLDGLLNKFYIQEKRPMIRLTILGLLANTVQNNRLLFENELVKIVLKHLGNVAEETDRAVRTSAAHLLVDLFLNCDPERSLDIIVVLEKLLNRAFDHEEIAKGEEDAEDIKTVAHGLVKGLMAFMFHYPPTPAIKAFTLITSHLETHYSNPTRLNQVTSIRYMLLECLLNIRADSNYRLGVLGHNNPPNYPSHSPFLMAHNHVTSQAPQISGGLIYTLSISSATKAIVKALRYELDWKVMLLLLQKIPNLLKNRALLVSKNSSDVDIIANAICGMVCEKSYNLPERLKNTPPKFTRTDFQNYVFPVLASLVSYHAHLDSTLQQRLIKCLECGLASKSARQCITALTICILEMRDAMVKLLPEVLLNLSKISATVHIAIPILEFLSTLTQLPKVFANFVGDQYMSVFAISLPYTHPFKYNHFTVSLAHHVIAAWFLKCRLPFRRDFVKFITKSLKGNLIPFEEGHLSTKTEIVNEDSSNRKRSSSLAEQGSRKPGRPPVSARIDLKPHSNDTLGAYHKELIETCLDLMAMYTFSTCSPLPKRQSTAKLLLSGGQSMTWLLGNKLITITTSGCTLKALKHGLCDRCFQVCRIQIEPSASPEYTEDKKKKSENKSTESIPSSNSSAPNTPDEDKPVFSENEPPRIEHVMYGTEKSERQVCACWCKGWAEIHIRRPTGSMSWAMRLQNEPHSVHMRDFSNSDISTLFLPTFASRNSETRSSMKGIERVGSEPVSIPCSPIRRHPHHDNEVFDYMTEEGSGRSRNPVRRSNSSPDMSSNWKNPILNADSDSDVSDSKKKQTYTKDMRVNCEAIPEEMGTTPPTSEALLLAQTEVTEAKPPVPTSPRISRDSELRGADPSGLPPLTFRDRGHTISVMSPVKKPARDWDLQKSPKPKNASQHRSGGKPAFVFLQLYHSAQFGDTYERPMLVTHPNSVEHLDWIPPYEVHKIGVLYVGPGQVNSEVDILRNEYGSPRYVEFLQRLGTLIDLAEANRQHVFLGGLETDGKDGKFAYIWQDDIMQVIFHVATLMPNSPNDPHANSKKLHIGNDFVTIVYNDSGEEYNFQTVKAQFNYAVVVVEPLELGTNQIIVRARDELVQHICHTDYKIISDQSVAILARQLALHSNLASLISSKQTMNSRDSYASNWLERLRLIKRIHNKLQKEAAINEDRSHSRHGGRLSQLDDFTEYT